MQLKCSFNIIHIGENVWAEEKRPLVITAFHGTDLS